MYPFKIPGQFYIYQYTFNKYAKCKEEGDLMPTIYIQISQKYILILDCRKQNNNTITFKKCGSLYLSLALTFISLQQLLDISIQCIIIYSLFFSILMKPVVGSSAEWKVAGENIKELAKCLEGYSEYLLEKKESIQSNQNLDHPVRTIDEHGTVEHRRMTSFEVKSQYKLLDQVVKSSPALTPVIFNEEKHLDKPFENAKQRLRYFEGLQLSVPIDIIRFSPGGSVVTTFCIFRVKADQTESEILIEGARMLQKARPYLQECHTRAQKALFRERLQNLTHVMPSVADLIYKELTLDAATAAHPTTQERLRRIFLGEKGLLADLRHLNAGRPTGKYDAFFEQLANVVEDITAADERRHNIAHLAEWLSLGELVRKTEEQCPPDTPVPSKSLVRLQFAPRNPYTHKALTFTSKIQVQYKIQRRQLRVTHPDEHYCAAQFKYFKEKAVELKEKAAVFFCDDKAKVPIGEPGAPISTGVRGKKSIAPSTTTLAAKDHDMSMSSVTPSVVLQCEVPDDATKSFVRGTVTTVVNDSVFQMSSPFRHAAALIKVMQQSQGKDAKILMKFTDGGTDQRNTLEAVKCASICIFYELNLDMVILARCAPGHSWMNPAERVMSILNIGLQNCALQRMESDEGTERELKKCGSMAQIRSLGEKKPEIKEKWMEIMEPIQSTIRNRFMRLALKDKPIQALDPVSEDEIDVLQRHLREHFPELDLHKLQKIHTQKVLSYKQWMEKHCRQRQYTFQIRKCDDEECCLRPTLDRENLNWLPDPVVNQSDEAHFLPYPSVKQQDTTEEARPSLKQVKVRTSKKNDARKDDIEQEVEGPEATGNENQELNQGNTEENTEHTGTEHELVEEPKFADFHLTTAQHARTAVSCTECRKPRVIYSKFALTDRQNMSLVKLLSEEYEYTCGAPVTPPRHILHGVTMSRDNLTCASPVEIPYYSSDMGRKDICCHCGVEESEVDNDMKKKFRTILPVWADCLKAGKVPVVSRPYGKERKK